MRQRADVLQLHPAAMPSSSGWAMVVVVEQLHLHAAHRSSNATEDADLVEDLEQRRQPGLDRVLHQDPLREGVQGADGGRVEVVERLVGRSALSLPASRVAQAFSNRARSRSRSSAPAFSVNVTAAIAGQRDAVGQHQRSHPVDQRPWSCRSQRPLDEEGRAGVGPDPLPRRCVMRGR